MYITVWIIIPVPWMVWDHTLWHVTLPSLFQGLCGELAQDTERLIRDPRSAPVAVRHHRATAGVET